MADRSILGIFKRFSRVRRLGLGDYGDQDVSDIARGARSREVLDRAPRVRICPTKRPPPQELVEKDLLHRSSWRSAGQAERPVRLGRDIEGEEAPTTRKSHAMGLKITKKDLDQHGYTMHGCPRCDHMIAWGDAKSCTQAHSETCRRRIAKELAKTPEGRERLKVVAAWKERHKVQELKEASTPAPRTAPARLSETRVHPEERNAEAFKICEYSKRKNATRDH